MPATAASKARSATINSTRAVSPAPEQLMWAERSEMRGELFIDVTAPAPLLIFGAVAYANHVAHLARVTGWRAYVINPRARFAASDRFPDAIDVLISWPGPALTQLGGIDRTTYLAVLSSDPKIDDEILRLALAAGNCRDWGRRSGTPDGEPGHASDRGLFSRRSVGQKHAAQSLRSATECSRSRGRRQGWRRQGWPVRQTGEEDDVRD